MHPRRYLSYSQLKTWEQSPELYRRIYLEDEKRPITRAMAYGSEIHDMIAKGVKGVKQYKLKEYELTVTAKVPLLARLDSVTPELDRFIEYKTSGKPWMQKRVDKDDQLTFYSALIYARTHSLPKSIHLVNILTETQLDEKLTQTGHILTFKTSRSLKEVNEILVRAVNAWRGIEKMVNDELL